MRFLLSIIGLTWVLSGFLLFSHPDSFRSFCRRSLPPHRVKRLAPVPTALGAALLFGAFTDDKLFWPLVILGALGTAKGIFLFASSQEKVARIMDEWFLMADPGTLRRYGIFTFCLGMALLTVST